MSIIDPAELDAAIAAAQRRLRRSDRIVSTGQAIGRGLAWFARVILWNAIRVTMWGVMIVGVGMLVLILSCVGGKSSLMHVKSSTVKD